MKLTKLHYAGIAVIAIGAFFLFKNRSRIVGVSSVDAPGLNAASGNIGAGVSMTGKIVGTDHVGANQGGLTGLQRGTP